MTKIGGGWYMEKMKKGLPPLRRQNLSKKAKEKYDKIKRKLYTANRNWNDWKLQLYWNKLEWVNPRSKIKGKKTYSNSSKKYYTDQDLITAHWVGH